MEKVAYKLSDMIKKRKKQKNDKIMLDKPKRKWYNVQAVPKKGVAEHGVFERRQKTFLKKFQKGIDKAKRKWYNSQAVPNGGSNGH